MMPIVDWQALSPAQRATTLRRPTQAARAEVITATREIIAEVRAGGDTALLELTRHFDGADLDSLSVGEAEFAAAARALASDVRQALEPKRAELDAIRPFQGIAIVGNVETSKGVIVVAERNEGLPALQDWPEVDALRPASVEGDFNLTTFDGIRFDDARQRRASPDPFIAH